MHINEENSCDLLAVNTRLLPMLIIRLHADVNEEKTMFEPHIVLTGGLRYSTVDWLPERSDVVS